MEKNWIVDHVTYGCYDDGEYHGHSGPYTEEEARELASAANRLYELEVSLSEEKDTRWSFVAVPIKLEGSMSLSEYEAKIKALEDKQAELKALEAEQEKTFFTWVGQMVDDECIEDQMAVSLAKKVATKVNRWVRRYRWTRHRRLVEDFS